MSNLLKNLLIALFLAALLWLGYVVFLKGEGGQSELLTSSAGTVSAEAALESQRLLAKLQELDGYDVSADIVSGAVFSSFVDFRVDLGSEPSGRPNPFAPVQ